MSMLTDVNISSIDLNLLVVLHAVFAEKSVVAAARKLHVTPSAVSNALARLRDQLGDPLFVRRGRGLVPTPRALELGPALSRTFDELSRALEHGQAFDARSCERQFRIALADNDQTSLLPSLARVFARQLPRACLHAVSIDTLISHGGLATPVADAAIGPRLDEPDLHHVPLYEEGAVVVVRRSHPEVPARAKSLSRELFLKLRHVDTHIALGKPGVGHRAAKDLFSRHGLTRDVALTVPSFSAAVMVAAKTDLVGAVPRRIAEAFAPYLPIRVLALPTESPRMPLFLVWHARTHQDPAATYFRKLVVDTAKRIKP